MGFACTECVCSEQQQSNTGTAVTLLTLLQIDVHPELADVLKAYAKAVIRTQPENLVEFSAK
jgi:hypothetical protein